MASMMVLPAMAADGTAGATVTPKFAKGGSDMCAPGMRHSRHGGFSKRLNLSDDQLEKIASLKNDLRTATASQKAQLKSLNFELKSLLLQPTVDKSKAMALEGNINSLKTDLATKRLSFKIDLLAVLTEDQKKELKHMMLAKQAFGGRYHHRGGFGGRA
jgi:Spy/CpxP family protein refolding chaperone